MFLILLTELSATYTSANLLSKLLTKLSVVFLLKKIN
ncbi:hypothetical protein JCM5805K_0758 [Lactococcus lactis subsp. lactis]|uniref:Uncharacterized protein n=1 Tax=Lactococcus lactis subsp. lactis TaxID=1360 RepID=A0A0B8QIR3_LACLL|nr:hypothetical protein JCM5805K_0758 [Lactococcus lactis subsp. lactis]